MDCTLSPAATLTTYADGSSALASWTADGRGAPSLTVANHTVAPNGFHFNSSGVTPLVSGGAYTAYYGQPLTLDTVSEHIIVEDRRQLMSSNQGSVRLWHLRGSPTPVSVSLKEACHGRGPLNVNASTADVQGKRISAVPVSMNGSLAAISFAGTGTGPVLADSYVLSWQCTSAERDVELTHR